MTGIFICYSFCFYCNLLLNLTRILKQQQLKIVKGQGACFYTTQVFIVQVEEALKILLYPYVSGSSYTQIKMISRPKAIFSILILMNYLLFAVPSRLQFSVLQLYDLSVITHNWFNRYVKQRIMPYVTHIFVFYYFVMLFDNDLNLIKFL